jgi:autotransporter strand-loop-strand O-heptosyltransferase
LSWTLDIPTVLISGFSTPISEFEGDNVIRIFNNKVCNGCFNRHKFDPGDWNWCPDYKGTERQFECTKSITGQMVINTLKTKGWINQLELSI